MLSKRTYVQDGWKLTHTIERPEVVDDAGFLGPDPGRSRTTVVLDAPDGGTTLLSRDEWAQIEGQDLNRLPELADRILADR